MIEFKKMIDTEKHLWCREAALVRVTGGRGALTSAWYEETDDYTVKSHLLLNGKPIVQGEYPECPTCCALLARGYKVIVSHKCEEAEQIVLDYIVAHDSKSAAWEICNSYWD